MKRVTSKRASNFGWHGGTVRPGETVSLPDEVAATLNPREWELVIAEPKESGRERPSIEALPADFPGKRELEADGRFLTPQAVAAASDADLDKVLGLGEATIKKIRAYKG